MILIFCIFCTVCIDFLISVMYVFSVVRIFGWCSRLGPVWCICRLFCLGISTVFGICEWRAICRFTVSSIIYHCLPVIISSICYHQLTSTFLYLLIVIKMCFYPIISSYFRTFTWFTFIGCNPYHWSFYNIC